jgi:hypothetical protein
MIQKNLGYQPKGLMGRPPVAGFVSLAIILTIELGLENSYWTKQNGWMKLNIINKMKFVEKLKTN